VECSVEPLHNHVFKNDHTSSTLHFILGRYPARGKSLLV